jgi:hypothetical protein
MEYYVRFWIYGYRIFPTGYHARRILTMVAIQGLEEWRPLNHPHHSRANPKSMFLFAGHLTGVAATAVHFVEHQC